MDFVTAYHVTSGYALTRCASQVVAQEAILPVGGESQGVAERRSSDAV